MRTFMKSKMKVLLSFFALVACMSFHTDSFAEGFDHVSRICTENCITLDTLKSFIPKLSYGGTGLAFALTALKFNDEEFELKDKEEREKMEAMELDNYYESLTEFQNKIIMSLTEKQAKFEDKVPDDLQKQINDMVKSANEVLADRCKEISLAMAKMKKEHESKSENKDKPLVSELKAKKEDLGKIKSGAVNFEVELKTLVNRATITDNQQAVELPNIGQLATRRLSMMEIFTRIQVPTGNHNGQIYYYDWDQATIARAAAMIAEGAAFPESTASWQRYSVPLRKVGDTLPVTEEFFEDEQMFASELEMFLMTNVDLEIDDQIANGDGTGENLNGLFQSTPAFNPAIVSKAENATFYDLLAIAQEQITKTGGAKYRPDMVVMNISSINKMRLTKDANNNYIIPPFVSPDGRVVDGLAVIESNIIPDNQFVMGDRRFGRIYEMAGMTISRGYVNSQFTEDSITLKVRKRLLFLIREVDKTGFVKVEDIDAAITAITAP